MAKKRKTPPVPKPEPESESESEPQQPPQPPPPQIEEHNQQQEIQVKEEDPEEEEEEDPEEDKVDLEVESKDEEDLNEEEDPEQHEQKDQNALTAVKQEEEDEEEEEEEVQKLLEPFTKDQLIEILREASEKHADVLEHIRKLSDTDPVHRKIFVHGLGWDTTSETLTTVFKEYGEIEDCNCVSDKVTGKSKGYAFILFKRRIGAKRALKEPQKKIGTRMTACQLASAGPVPTGGVVMQPLQAPAAGVNVSEYTLRKIYVSNVAADIDVQKLVAFFSKFGEIEEGPLGLDKQTGKPKGFALFVYKSVESARKALEEPHKTFEGHVLHCQKAIDGPKPSKTYFNAAQQHGHGGGRPSKFPRNDSVGFGGSHLGGGGHLMAQSAPGMQYNQGVPQAAGLNPVLGQALTALLASQTGGGLGLTNLLGSLGSAGVGAAVNPDGAPMINQMQGGYGNPQVGGGYGGQGGMQGGYPQYPQMGQGSAGRSQKGGHMGGGNPYMGH